jgi:hypothetical protein
MIWRLSITTNPIKSLLKEYYNWGTLKSGVTWSTITPKSRYWKQLTGDFSKFFLTSDFLHAA